MLCSYIFLLSITAPTKHMDERDIDFFPPIEIHL